MNFQPDVDVSVLIEQTFYSRTRTNFQSKYLEFEFSQHSNCQPLDCCLCHIHSSRTGIVQVTKENPVTMYDVNGIASITNQIYLVDISSNVRRTKLT